MSECIWWIVTMIDNRAKAVELSRQAVEKKLAACVQIEGPVLSVYSWKGSLEEGEEYRLILKVPDGKKDSLMDWLSREHPYEVPEILAWPVREGLPAYMSWVRDF